MTATQMTKDEFLLNLHYHIMENIKGGYFMDPEEDEDGYNHDELQALIEHFYDDSGYEGDVSYRDLADEHEALIGECFEAGLVEVVE